MVVIIPRKMFGMKDLFLYFSCCISPLKVTQSGWMFAMESEMTIFVTHCAMTFIVVPVFNMFDPCAS